MILCLQIYKADASIAVQNGETPLHWLIAFGDECIKPMIKDLMAQGADIGAPTKEIIALSEFPGTIDVDLQLPGTALS